MIHAVREGCVDSVVKLLELGADRMVQNRDKQTAADIAELYENKDILHCLQVSRCLPCDVRLVSMICSLVSANLGLMTFNSLVFHVPFFP